MTERACHVVRSTTRLGLTQALDAMIKFLITAFLVLASGSAIACGCDMPRSTEDLRPEAIVFEGQAISHLIRPDSPSCVSNGVPVLSSGGEVVTFKVTKNIRGSTDEYINISVNGNTSCDLQRFDFKRGDKYRLSILPHAGQTGATDHDAYWNSICDLRVRI
ncbi:hypothetical protein [Luteimonas sp. A537]